MLTRASRPWPSPSRPTPPEAGRDLFWWLTRLGLMRVTAGSRLGRRLSGRPDFVIGSSRRRLLQAGVRLRPRMASADGRAAHFSDGGSLETGIVIWATGYRSEYSWVRDPGVIQGGKVVHRRGVTAVQGLYFLGLTWQHTRGSALLGFVHEDAAYLASRLTTARATRDGSALAAPGPAADLRTS